MQILALPYGYSVAHTSRLLEIAGALRARGHSVSFAGGGKVLGIARSAGYDVAELEDDPIEENMRAVRCLNFGQLYGDPERLARWVRAELALYERIAPDLILADERKTPAISAALAGLPHVAVVNAHLTNYSVLPLLFPGYNRSRIGQGWMSRLRRRLQLAVERRVYHAGLGGFVALRRRLGLSPVFAYDVAAGNDLTLVPDVPAFTPLARPPASMHYIGPITWRSGLPAPAGLDAFLTGARRVLFSVGSGGLEALVARLAAAAPPGYSFLVAAGEQVAQVRAQLGGARNILVERYVNADLLLPHCDAIVCHGGNGTVYQALRHGVPVVALPTHNEQDYNARRVEQLGLGRRIHARAALSDFGRVLRALEAVTSEPAYRVNARRFQLRLAEWDGPAAAAALIDSLPTASRQRGAAQWLISA